MLGSENLPTCQKYAKVQITLDFDTLGKGKKDGNILPQPLLTSNYCFRRRLQSMFDRICGSLCILLLFMKNNIVMYRLVQSTCQCAAAVKPFFHLWFLIYCNLFHHWPSLSEGGHIANRRKIYLHSFWLCISIEICLFKFHLYQSVCL